METNVIRPRIFQKSLRIVIFALFLVFIVLGLFQINALIQHGAGISDNLWGWSFIISFLLAGLMILIYLDQEEKSKYYIRWTDRDVFYKLSKEPEQRVDLSLVNYVGANYSKVFFHLKDGSVKLVNFYSLDPRFKDVQKALTINEVIQVLKQKNISRG